MRSRTRSALLLAALLATMPALLPTTAQAAPVRASMVHANHITGYDCEVNDEQRGPYSNVSMGIRWSNSDTAQKMVQFTIHNWANLPATITVRYLRGTDGHVYKQQGFVVASTSTIFVSGWENIAHSQAYHAGVKIYRDGTYVMTINLWYASYRGNVTFVANLTNCTPQGLTQQALALAA